MNFSLLLPGALLALTAVILPLLIHLSRRSEQKPTDFAALRWLSAQLRPRKKLVFQEIPLLLLRLLLLIALAVFLAKPVSLQSGSPKRWVVVVPGSAVSAAKNLPAYKKTEWKAPEWHWLSPGFPDYENKPDGSSIPVSSLLRELDAQLPANTALTIFVPEELAGLDGERIRLSRKVEWKIVPGKQNSVTPAQAGAQKLNASDAISLGPRQEHSGMTKLFLNSDQATRIRFAIRHDNKHLDEARYFRAAYVAWQAENRPDEKDAVDSADIASPLKQNSNSLVWLAAGELPAEIREWAQKGGTIIVSKETPVPEIKSGAVAWRNQQGKVLARVTPLGQGRILQWQQVLKPEAMPELLDANFPDHLKALLQAAAPAPMRALATSQNPLTGAKAFAEVPHSLQIWLALLIAVLFFLERWLANVARRWSPA